MHRDTDAEAETPCQAMPCMSYHAVLHSILPRQLSYHLISLFETIIPIEDQVGEELEREGADVQG
jgi:hypothetical protein